MAPFESWSPEQQEAVRELSRIVGARAAKIGAQLILANRRLLEARGFSGPDIETEAVRGALTEIRSEPWTSKARADWLADVTLELMTRCLESMLGRGHSKTRRKRRGGRSAASKGENT